MNTGHIFYKTLFYLPFLILSISSFSQDLQNLDKKFGINKFKLESDISLYKSGIVFDLKGDDNVEYYYYTGQDFKTLFGVKYEKCALGFYKSKLYTISIQFGVISTFDESVVHYKLKSLFGLPDLGISKGPLDYLWLYFWQTTKTYLAFAKMSDTSEYEPRTVSVFMFSREMQKQINNDNF